MPDTAVSGVNGAVLCGVDLNSGASWQKCKSPNAEVYTQHWKTIEAVFLAAGFKFDRQEGSHRSYVKPGVARPVVIPVYKEVPVFIIRNNLKTGAISREEYFALLEKAK